MQHAGCCALDKRINKKETIANPSGVLPPEGSFLLFSVFLHFFNRFPDHPEDPVPVEPDLGVGYAPFFGQTRTGTVLLYLFKLFLSAQKIRHIVLAKFFVAGNTGQ